jgi:glutamate dehydrogenase/leucine dehydrogenase
MVEENPFEIALKQLDDCAKLLKLDPDVHEILRHPLRELHVSIPVRMDDGTTRWVPRRVAFDSIPRRRSIPSCARSRRG